MPVLLSSLLSFDHAFVLSCYLHVFFTILCLFAVFLFAFIERLRQDKEPPSQLPNMTLATTIRADCPAHGCLHGASESPIELCFLPADLSILSPLLWHVIVKKANHLCSFLLSGTKE